LKSIWASVPSGTLPFFPRPATHLFFQLDQRGNRLSPPFVFNPFFTRLHVQFSFVLMLCAIFLLVRSTHIYVITTLPHHFGFSFSSTIGAPIFCSPNPRCPLFLCFGTSGRVPAPPSGEHFPPRHLSLWPCLFFQLPIHPERYPLGSQNQRIGPPPAPSSFSPSLSEFGRYLLDSPDTPRHPLFFRYTTGFITFSLKSFFAQLRAFSLPACTNQRPFFVVGSPPPSFPTAPIMIHGHPPPRSGFSWHTTFFPPINRWSPFFAVVIPPFFNFSQRLPFLTLFLSSCHLLCSGRHIAFSQHPSVFFPIKPFWASFCLSEIRSVRPVVGLHLFPCSSDCAGRPTPPSAGHITVTLLSLSGPAVPFLD